MAIRRDELQVMPWIGFMRAGQRQPKVLLLLGQFLAGRLFRFAQIVDPEDATLSLLESSGLRVSRRRNDGPEKLGNRFDLQFVAFREGHGPGCLESPRDF